MIPTEGTHYNAWAKRLEAGLAHAYPQTVWAVLNHESAAKLPRPAETPLGFRIIARTPGSERRLRVHVPFTLVVDEEAFALVIVALGRELERRLAAMPDGFDVR